MGLRRLRRRRLERARPGRRLHQRRLPRRRSTPGSTSTWRPTAGRASGRSTLAGVKAGTIPMARLDDAVRRILRVKYPRGHVRGGQAVGAPVCGPLRTARLARAPRDRARGGGASRWCCSRTTGVLPLKRRRDDPRRGRRRRQRRASSRAAGRCRWQGTGTTPRRLPRRAPRSGAGIDAAVKAAGGTRDARARRPASARSPTPRSSSSARALCRVPGRPAPTSAFDDAATSRPGHDDAAARRRACPSSRCSCRAGRCG